MPRKKTRILASGKFDVLHPGHIYYLRKASELAEASELWVVIAHEANIDNCVFSNEERKELLEALGSVNRVIVGKEEKDFRGTLERVKPDIIALGYDQDGGKIEDLVEEVDMEVEIKKIDGLKPEEYSSSRFKERMENA